MARVEKSVYLDAPVETVSGYLKDLNSNLEWLPGMTEVETVRGSGEAVGARFCWVYKMTGISLRGESTVLEYVPNERFVTRSQGSVTSTWTWEFCSEKEGTRIDLTVDYEVPVPVVGRLAEALVLSQNERKLETGLANIKGRFGGEGQEPRDMGAEV